METAAVVPQEIVEAVQYGHLQTFLDFINSHRTSPSPMIDVEGCSLLHWAAINNRISYIHLLLDKGANINYAGGLLNENPLQWAVRNPLHGNIVLDLIKRGADMNHLSNIGMDAVQIACRSGNVNIVYLLLIHNANMDSPDHHGDTALHWLLKNPELENQLDLIRLLLRFGADLYKEDSQGNNAILILCQSKRYISKRLLSIVCKYGGKRLIKSVSSKTGQSPQQTAYSTGNYQMIQFMFDLYIYYTLPSWLIISVHASSICLIFWGFLHYQWIGGFVFMMGITIIVSRLDILNIELSSSRTIHGKVYGLITGLLSIYLHFLSSHHQHYYTLAVILGSCCIYYTLYRCAATRPCEIVVQSR